MWPPTCRDFVALRGPPVLSKSYEDPYWLVVEPYPSEKWWSSPVESVGMIIPNISKVIPEAISYSYPMNWLVNSPWITIRITMISSFPIWKVIQNSMVPKHQPLYIIIYIWKITMLWKWVNQRTVYGPVCTNPLIHSIPIAIAIDHPIPWWIFPCYEIGKSTISTGLFS